MLGAQSYCPFTGKAPNEINQSFPSDLRRVQLSPSAEKKNVGKHGHCWSSSIAQIQLRAFESLNSHWNDDLKIR